MMVYVVRLDLVRAAIKALQEQRIHNHFPGYMLMRRLVARGEDPADLPFHANDLVPMLSVPNGPPDRPVFRPFSSRRVSDPSVWWMTKHQAGSYTPSSIRNTASFMLDENNRYRLSDGHPQQALAAFMKGTRSPAWAMAAYFMRNHGFDIPSYEDDDGFDILVGGFRTYFGIEDENDFEVLFDPDARPEPPVEIWLESWGSPAEPMVVAETSHGTVPPEEWTDA